MKQNKIKLAAVLFMLVLLGLVFYFYNQYEYIFTIENLQKHLMSIELIKKESQIMFIICFILFYSIIVAANIPITFLLSISSGIFFGSIIGAIYASFAASIGALITYIAVRILFFDYANSKVQQYIPKLKSSYLNNEWRFLFVLRFIPGPPFALQNLIATILGASPYKFFISTLIGVLPVGFILTSIGANINHIIQSGEKIGPHLIYKPQNLIVLFVLIALVIGSKYLKKLKS